MAFVISELGPPKGFHPISNTKVYLPNPLSSYNSCSLHLHYTLPPLVFVDTHELAQRDSSYSFRHWGSRDLERPAHALPDENSELLLDVRFLAEEVGHSKTAAGKGEGTTIDVEVPMHLRYGKPRAPASSEEGKTGPYEEVHVDWPKAFLKCSSPLYDHASIPLPQRILLALPSLNSEKDSVFTAIPPHVDFSSKTSSLLFLPVGNPKDLAIVEGVTVVTMLVCFIFLLRTSRRTAVRLTRNSTRPKTA
ncbi:PIG-X [Gymnopilus junonius]|uniref:Protein PBN1 n=1 Tax=Gymnopilus junonius TaxID=109634 RepID=A0A9P5TNN5_GYMJU|nr:PIG-X [Gymnopilus junonius]